VSGDVRQLRAEPLTGVVAEHGEGPVWDERRGRLLSMDMLAGALLATDPSTGDTSRHDLPSPVAAMARPTADGDRWLVVGEREVLLADADLARFERIGELPVRAGVRANEGGCDPSGRLYVGTMAYDQTPGAGDLFVRQLDGVVEVALPGVTISNGLSFGPEPSTAYYVDTATQALVQLHLDARGHVASQRTVADVPEPVGAPDGLTVDAEGGIWVALWGGSAVHRYTPDGVLDVRIELPVPQVTACAFGGPGLRELFITTSREALQGDPGAAGSVFRCTPGPAGLPPLPFGG
jgi:sugar lactone lactonase YvrE